MPGIPLRNLRRVMCLALICSALATIFIGSPAFAKTTPDDVSQIVITGSSSGTRSTLRLNFDHPISTDQASQIEDQLASSRPATAKPLISGTPLWCNSNDTFVDTNGVFTIQYTCGSPSGTLAWGFQLSSANQSIAVGLVNEKGLSWWRSGHFGGQNTPHSYPAYFTFHGSMNPVYANNYVDYSDLYTFRHNLGGGGTASLSVAGTVTLMQ